MVIIMMGVKSIIFEKNEKKMIINISDSNELQYGDVYKYLSDDIVFKYIHTLLSIINDWKYEYIDTSFIDGVSWKLSVTYVDNYKKEYKGKALFPANFESLERLNQELIEGA